MKNLFDDFDTNNQFIKKHSTASRVIENNQEKQSHLHIWKNKKPMAKSTYIDQIRLSSNKNIFRDSRIMKQATTNEENQTLKRATSSRQFQLKYKNLPENSSKNELDNNLVKLRLEEMIFKIKTRLGTLLKQINIPYGQLNRYANIVNIEEIIEFLSEKVKNKLFLIESEENKIMRVRSKEKEVYDNIDLELDSLRKRLIDKDILEKTIKNRQKQLNNEVKELYDKINKKQKELSSKLTELYQAKSIVKENQKAIESLQNRCSGLQRQRNELREQVQRSNKSEKDNFSELSQQNYRIQNQLSELRQTLQILQQKQDILQENNSLLNDQIIRWQDRYEWLEKECQISKNKVILSENFSHQDCYTPSSLNFNDDSLEKKYNFKIKQLERQNANLRGQLENILKAKGKALLDEKEPEQNVSEVMISNEMKGLQFLKQKNPDLYGIQIQSIFRKKTQKIAKQWKDRMYDLINKYEDELDQLRNEINIHKKDKEEMQRQVVMIAKDKYELELSLINKKRPEVDIKVKKKLSQLEQPIQEENTIISITNSEKIMASDMVDPINNKAEIIEQPESQSTTYSTPSKDLIEK